MLLAVQETWVPFLGGEDSWRGYGNPLLYSCLENSMDKRSLAGYRPWGHKESDRTELLSRTHTHTHTGNSFRNGKEVFFLFVLFVLFHVLFEPAPNDRHCFLLIEPICKLVEYSRSSGRNLSKLYLNYLIYDWLLTSGSHTAVLIPAGTLANNVNYHFKAVVCVSFQNGHQICLELQN